jgi:N-acetylglucosaminyldiphosphoundecaprenol N-acetyl-beta-D-mannosaminyltransferase
VSAADPTSEGGASRREVRIRGLPFLVVGYADVLERFSGWLRSDRAPRQVCTVNVHTFVTSMGLPALRRVYDRAAVLTLDGQPLRWYANLVEGAGVPETVAGPELMLRCLDRGRAEGWRHYLLGGRPEVLADLERRMLARFPGVRIVGTHSPPFRALTPAEEAALVARINESGADFLWVGLGAPKQEIWIDAHLREVRVPVQIGVGAAFDFWSGAVPRAPGWMQRAGLEWLYRLWQDPRLWRRYLATNPVFLGILAADLLRSRLGIDRPAGGAQG